MAASWCPGASVLPAVFLTHGGHTWDTLFAVGSQFGVATEEIDGLEAMIDALALPDPGDVPGVAAGAVLLAWLARRPRVARARR